MKRPYIFCHMLTSLDGKIMGNYMNLQECDEPSDKFYDIAFGKMLIINIKAGCQEE